MMTGEESLKEGLRGGDRAAVKQIYQQFHSRITQWVVTNSGTKMEADDLFQDALTVIYQKMQQPEFSIQHQFYTYLFSICRNLWFKRLRDDKLRQSTQDEELDTIKDDPSTDVNVFDLRQQIFRRKFAQLGTSCRKIIELSLQGLSPVEIANKLALKSERHATNRKSYCKQQLAKMVKEDPLYKELMA